MATDLSRELVGHGIKSVESGLESLLGSLSSLDADLFACELYVSTVGLSSSGYVVVEREGRARL